MEYVHTRTLEAEFDPVVDATQDALADEGFGVLCDIDVQATFAEKLGIEDYRDYRILGACNPSLAKQALDSETTLGALLPCNAVVYRDGDAVTVAVVDAERMLTVVDNPDLDDVAAEVNERFSRVLEAVDDRF